MKHPNHKTSQVVCAQLCQQLPSTCWLDDGSTIPFAPVPEGEETRIHSADILRLAWRKVEVARWIANTNH